MSTLTPYLISGVTGGLGAKVLQDMLDKHHVPKSSIVVTSRSEGNRERFESQGLTFRVLDYNRPETITSALQNVDNFLFVSSSEFRDDKRRVEHRNVVDAAKAAGVRKTWYVSLAFGGFKVDDSVSFQRIHNETEVMLIESGLDFVSLRAGAYGDAFPLFINWHASSPTINLPELDPPMSQGNLALTSRDELGEGIATLLVKGFEAFPSIQPQTDRKIVLLTANKTVSFIDIANTVNEVRGIPQPIVYQKPEDWIVAATAENAGAQPRSLSEARIGWLQQMCKGVLEATDPALKTLLGREPLDGIQLAAQMLEADPAYSWHQQANKGRAEPQK